MSRINLYLIKMPKGLDYFYKTVLPLEVKPEASLAIEVLRFNNKYLDANFFQKIKFKDVFSNPFGEKQTIEYEYYQSINFKILEYENNYILLVINAPKSTRSFFNFLSNTIGMGYTITDLILNLEKISEVFEKKYNASILKAKYSQVSLSKSAVANIEIISSTNAINEFNIIYENKYRQLQKMKIRINTLLEESDFEINSSGSISTLNSDINHDSDFQSILAILKDAISISLSSEQE